MANITLHWVRLGFPHLFEPRAIMLNGVPSGEPRYSANLHLPAGFDATPLQQEIVSIIAAQWPDPARRPPICGVVGGDPYTWTNTLPGYLRIPLVWGPKDCMDDPNATGWVLRTSARQDSRPFIVKLVNGAPVQIHDYGEVYPGVECHTSVGIFTYDKGVQSRGVSCGLNGVLLTGRDLGRFDNKPTLNQMFGPGAGGVPPAPPLPPGATPAAPAQAREIPFGPPAAPTANPFG